MFVDHIPAKQRNLGREHKVIQQQISNIAVSRQTAGRTRWRHLAIKSRRHIRLRQTYYDQGEKAGKLLAWCLKTEQNARTITEIVTANGDKTADPQINNTLFESYYTQLYSLECLVTNESFQDFFDQLTLPSLSEEAKGDLDSPITSKQLTK